MIDPDEAQLLATLDLSVVSCFDGKHWFEDARFTELSEHLTSRKSSDSNMDYP